MRNDTPSRTYPRQTTAPTPTAVNPPYFTQHQPHRQPIGFLLQNSFLYLTAPQTFNTHPFLLYRDALRCPLEDSHITVFPPSPHFSGAQSCGVLWVLCGKEGCRENTSFAWSPGGAFQKSCIHICCFGSQKGSDWPPGLCVLWGKTGQPASYCSRATAKPGKPFLHWRRQQPNKGPGYRALMAHLSSSPQAEVSHMTF